MLAIKSAAVAARTNAAPAAGAKGKGTPAGFPFPLDLHSIPLSYMGRRMPPFLFCDFFQWGMIGCRGIQWAGTSARPDRPSLARPHIPALRLVGERAEDYAGNTSLLNSFLFAQNDNRTSLMDMKKPPKSGGFHLLTRGYGFSSSVSPAR